MTSMSWMLCWGMVLSVTWSLSLMNVAGQSASCSGLDDFISNLNKSELSFCRIFSSCSGVQCVNVDPQLRHIAELFNFTLLTCKQPTPAILVELLGQQDPIHNNARRLLYRQELRNSTTIPIGSGEIVLGAYYFTVYSNIGTIGIAIDRGMTTVLNYTVITLPPCPSTTTSSASTDVKDTTASSTLTTTGQATGIVTGSNSNHNIIEITLGVSIPLTVIVATIASCLVLVGYGCTHKESRVGCIVMKLLRPGKKVFMEGTEYTDQVPILNEEEMAYEDLELSTASAIANM